jgi:hypothetical protein
MLSGSFGANYRGRRFRRWGSEVKVAEDEHGPPKEEKAYDLVRIHCHSEKRPVENDRRSRKSQLSKRRVRSPGAGKTSVIQEQGYKTGDQGQEHDRRQLSSKSGSYLT